MEGAVSFQQSAKPNCIVVPCDDIVSLFYHFDDPFENLGFANTVLVADVPKIDSTGYVVTMPLEVGLLCSEDLLAVPVDNLEVEII